MDILCFKGNEIEGIHWHDGTKGLKNKFQRNIVLVSRSNIGLNMDFIPPPSVSIFHERGIVVFLNIHVTPPTWVPSARKCGWYWSWWVITWRVKEKKGVGINFTPSRSDGRHSFPFNGKDPYVPPICKKDIAWRLCKVYSSKGLL